VPKDHEKHALSLFVSHRDDLMKYAGSIVGDRAVAEDIVQEAWLRYADKTKARWLEKPERYLYRIVRNLALDRQRRANLERRHTSDHAEEGIAQVADKAPLPEQEAIASQDLQRVMAALDELPERTRIALEMHRFGGHTLKEIAQHLDISVSMAQVLVMQGIKHCQRAL
jgi:RNA polymerase sigma-70 factor (ECF subfamily)